MNIVSFIKKLFGYKNKIESHQDIADSLKKPNKPNNSDAYLRRRMVCEYQNSNCAGKIATSGYKIGVESGTIEETKTKCGTLIPYKPE